MIVKGNAGLNQVSDLCDCCKYIRMKSTQKGEAVNKSFAPDIKILRQGWWISQNGYHKQTAPRVHRQSGERITLTPVTMLAKECELGIVFPSTQM
jgi:hypothetical protein